MAEQGREPEFAPQETLDDRLGGTRFHKELCNEDRSLEVFFSVAVAALINPS